MCASIKMLNLTISELRSIAKKKKKTGEKEKDIIEVCKGMSRKELDNILNKKSTFPSRPIKHKSTHKPKPVKNKPLIKVDEFESVTQRL